MELKEEGRRIEIWAEPLITKTEECVCVTLGDEENIYFRRREKKCFKASSRDEKKSLIFCLSSTFASIEDSITAREFFVSSSVASVVNPKFLCAAKLLSCGCRWREDAEINTRRLSKRLRHVPRKVLLLDIIIQMFLLSFFIAIPC